MLFYWSRNLKQLLWFAYLLNDTEFCRKWLFWKRCYIPQTSRNLFQVVLSLKNIPFPTLNLNQEYFEQGYETTEISFSGEIPPITEEVVRICSSSYTDFSFIIRNEQKRQESPFMTSQPSFATYVKQSSSTKGNTQNHPSAVAHIPGLAVTVPNHLIYSRETLKLYRDV